VVCQIGNIAHFLRWRIRKKSSHDIHKPRDRELQQPRQEPRSDGEEEKASVTILKDGTDLYPPSQDSLVHHIRFRQCCPAKPREVLEQDLFKRWQAPSDHSLNISPSG